MADGEYVHGSQDIHEQQATFALFWTLTKWSSVLIVIALILLAFTRTTAVDCKKADVAKAHPNSCAKTLATEGAAAE